jgi:hypothetical protein
MTRHDVPGGGWFDLLGPDALTEDHQNQYLDLLDKLKDDKRQALAALAPAAHPLAAPDDETPVTLSRAEERPVRELVESWVLTGSSYGVPLARPLPLLAVNVLRQSLRPVYSALNGVVVPKENQDGDSTSTPTSPGDAAVPPAPPGQEP